MGGCGAKPRCRCGAMVATAGRGATALVEQVQVCDVPAGLGLARVAAAGRSGATADFAAGRQGPHPASDVVADEGLSRLRGGSYLLSRSSTLSLGGLGNLEFLT